MVKSYMPNKKLVIFDVDGVLLDNKMGGLKDILVLLGKEKEAKVIDKEYQKRKHLGPWGLEELAKLYQGFSSKNLKKIALEYCSKSLMKGAGEAITGFEKKNYLIGAFSSNPQFVMDGLSQILPLNFSFGTRLEFKNGAATGKILRKVDRYIKAKILKEKIKEFNFQKRDVVVIGDSLTDLPIAELAGLFIAFNAKKEVRERADIVVKEKDLKEILKYI